jgi:hypothetical protein
VHLCNTWRRYATLKSGRLLHWMRDVALTAAEAVRLVPRGTAEIHRMLTKTAAALVSGGEQVRAAAIARVCLRFTL